jgi:hypothetical protein
MRLVYDTKNTVTSQQCDRVVQGFTGGRACRRSVPGGHRRRRQMPQFFEPPEDARHRLLNRLG